MKHVLAFFGLCSFIIFAGALLRLYWLMWKVAIFTEFRFWETSVVLFVHAAIFTAIAVIDEKITK